MIYGIGVDLVDIRRIAAVHQRHGARFVERLLHPDEHAAFARQREPARYLAKAFATKEAFVKALGTGFRGVAHDEVGATRDAQGRPALIFSAALQARLGALGIAAHQLSLSDERDYVCAFVTLERGEAVARSG